MQYITRDRLTLGLRHVVDKTAATAARAWAMPGWKGTSIKLCSHCTWHRMPTQAHGNVRWRCKFKHVDSYGSVHTHCIVLYFS